MFTPCKVLSTLLLLTVGAVPALAGSLEPPAPPTDPASALYTAQDLYNRLTTGAAGARRSGPFAEPTAPPGATGHTTDEIMAVMPAADNAAGATMSDVANGKSFWGVRTDGAWGPKVGTMPLQTLNPDSTAVAAGFYAATSLEAVDPDLVSANIRSGATVFGVGGSVLPASGAATAGDVLAGVTFSNASGAATGTMPNQGAVTIIPGTVNKGIPAGYHNGAGIVAGDGNLLAGNIKSGITLFGVAGSYTGGTTTTFPIPMLETGQTTCYKNTGTVSSPVWTVTDCAGTRQDGDLKAGLEPPTPRFTDNRNGTVTDNATGLIWLKKVDCSAKKSWENSLSFANNLANGACNLSDGSHAEQWRLPNVKELQSLLDYGNFAPALPTGHPFVNVLTASKCWTSDTAVINSSYGWYVDLTDGSIGNMLKSTTSQVTALAVRGGQ